jgi:hypothetical protein
MDKNDAAAPGDALDPVYDANEGLFCYRKEKRAAGYAGGSKRGGPVAGSLNRG